MHNRAANDNGGTFTLINLKFINSKHHGLYRERQADKQE